MGIIHFKQFKLKITQSFKKYKIEKK